MAILRAIVQSAKKFHQKHQMTSNTLMTIGLLGAGDLITQYIEIKVVNSSEKFEFPSSQELWKMVQKFQLPTSEELWKITSETFDAAKISNMLAESSKQMKVKSKEDKKDDKDSFLANVDWVRAAKLSAVGLVMGPFSYKWYSYLDRLFPTKTSKIILYKVILDQLFAAPLMNVMSIAGCFEYAGKSFDDMIQYYKEKFLVIYTYDCAIWPAAQVVNFLFVSPVYRVLYVNGVSLMWNSILSFLMFEQEE